MSNINQTTSKYELLSNFNWLLHCTRMDEHELGAKSYDQYQLAIEASLNLLLEQYCLCNHELNSSSTNDISAYQSALSYKSHETSYDKT